MNSSKKYKNLIIGSIFALTCALLVLLPSSCRKDLLLSNEALQFSTDTVLFDTVFTTVGSTTQRFKIYNPSSRPVIISSIILKGGENSKFRFNLDGVSGTNFKDIRIPGRDSLFAFVEVTLDPNDQSNPLIVEDELLFLTNGKEQTVTFAAWGQDAYFYYNDVFPEGTLPNDKPHVIYGFAAVDSSQTVIIQAGTNIHLHNNSLIFVYKGALEIEGTEENKVVIQGDRLEPFYADVKGQYYGVYFQEALPSRINHAIIKNGTAGIHVFSEDPSNTSYTLEITNTEIFNHASYGVFNYAGGKIYGENLLVHNVNLYAFFQLEGGEFTFKQSHFLGYGTDGNQPAVAIRNYFTRSDGLTYVGDIPQGNFYNSVIYGSGNNQVVFDTTLFGGAAQIDCLFKNNVIKQDEPYTSSFFEDNIWNIDPQFISITEQNFKYPTSSILINNGNPSPVYTNTTDIRGIVRNPSSPDIGAYEINE